VTPEQPDLIVRMVCRGLAPFIQLFGLYVIMHGHSSPGGGFQGGVILASSFILLAMAEGSETLRRRLSLTALTGFMSAGVLLYAGIGVVCLVLGANYLDYGVLPFSEPRSVGMLVIEIGIGITVTAAMLSIFRDLLTF
jgi:multicomponent Na+:H+ antiporter subunit B|tara:strand:+ start:1421 stop:1834 length:414 start_codon:yes stop_codon:yes gene_type:complete